MEQVRLGMIGCGGIARHHMSILQDIPEATIVALVDPNPDQIAQCRKQFPNLADVPVFSTPEEMYAKVELDAVEISTPHTQHAEQVLQAIAAGKHVLCEKPLATTTADANRLCDAIDASGLVGVLAYQRHYIPLYLYIKEKLESGELGEITFFSAVLGQAWKRGTAGTWRQQKALSGGGQINDSGSHVVDVMLAIFGLRPVTVAAFCDNRGTEVDIDSAVAIRYANGALGNLSVLGDFPIWHEDFSVGCERGGFLVREGKVIEISHDGQRRVVDNELPPGNTPSRNFVMAVLGREEVGSPFHAAREVIRFTEAVWRSADQGGAPVDVASVGA